MIAYSHRDDVPYPLIVRNRTICVDTRVSGAVDLSTLEGVLVRAFHLGNCIQNINIVKIRSEQKTYIWSIVIIRS